MAWNGSATMTATNMLPPPAKRLLIRFTTLAAFAFAPKGVLCGLAYAGLFGLGGVELCGESPATWPGALPIAAGVIAAGTFFLLNRRRRSAVSLA